MRVRSRIGLWTRPAVVLVALGLLVHCSDGTSAGDQLYLRFRANGSLVEYTRQASLVATFSQSGSQYGVVLSASDASSNINLQAYDDAAIQTTTYSGFSQINSTMVGGVIIGYEDASGTRFTSGSVSPVDASVVLTELTATQVRGTFTARLAAAGQPDLVVTQGEFLLQRFN